MSLADDLVEKSSPHGKAEWLANIFDRLLWIMSDNGQEIVESAIGWLDGDDKRKIKIALLISEVALDPDRESFMRRLERISTTWPELRETCDMAAKRFDEWTLAQKKVRS